LLGLISCQSVEYTEISLVIPIGTGDVSTEAGGKSTENGGKGQQQVDEEEHQNVLAEIEQSHS
jgi:hypothetical protein